MDKTLAEYTLDPLTHATFASGPVSDTRYDATLVDASGNGVYTHTFTVIDGFRGTVKEIGIRTTQIEDAGGDIKVVNNSDIRTLIDMTSQLSLAICEVDIEHGESLERVEVVIKNNLKPSRRLYPIFRKTVLYGRFRARSVRSTIAFHRKVRGKPEVPGRTRS